MIFRAFRYHLCLVPTLIIHKPLVCGLFGPHPHAHRTKIAICGARTRTPFFAPARAPAHFSKKIHFLKKNLLLKIKFFVIFLQKNEYVRRTSACTRGARTHPHARFWKLSQTYLHKNRRTRTCVRPYPAVFCMVRAREDTKWSRFKSIGSIHWIIFMSIQSVKLYHKHLYISLGNEEENKYQLLFSSDLKKRYC